MHHDKETHLADLSVNITTTVIDLLMARSPSEEKAKNATSTVYEMMLSSSFMTGVDDLDALSNSTSTISVHKTRA